MTILSPTSSFKWFLIYTTHAWSLTWVRGGCLVFCLSNHFIFFSSLWCFFLCFAHKVGLPHPFTLGVIHCICGQPLIMQGLTFFIVPIVRNKLHPTMRFEMLLPIEKDAWFYVLHWTNPCPSTTFPLVFLWTSWHCVISRWHSHLGWHIHCQSYLNIFDVLNYFILQGDRDDGGSDKWKTFSWSAPNRHIPSPCFKGFWVPTPTCKWLSSSMC
jgi:hypothetical protein